MNDTASRLSGFDENEPSTPIIDYRDLLVWKEGMTLATDIYGFTKEFPREELYGLTSQLRRAATSIPANIAEGFGRETTGAYIQFLRIAQGSLKELETLADLSTRLSYLREDISAKVGNDCARIGKMLRSLIRALERRNGS